MGWELVDFLASRGLTRGFAGVFGVVERKKRPGLKPRDSMRLIQGAEAPAPSGRGKGGAFVEKEGKG